MRATKATLARPAAVLVPLVFVGVYLRTRVLGSPLGGLNADEASAGLQALGVVRDGRFPIVLDGLFYTGAVDVYFISPIVSLAGGSAAVLKWLYTCVWAVGAVATFFAARRLRDGRSATAAGVLVWLPPGALFVLSTLAYPGYAMSLTVVACTIWAAAIVADQSKPTARQSALVGFLAGFGFFIHPMFLATLLPIVGVAAFVHRREWRAWWLPASGAAIAANIPFFAWNATNGWPSLTEQVHPPGSFWDRLEGFVRGLLPRGFGLLNPDGTAVFGEPIWVLLYVGITAGIVFGCVTLVRGSRKPSRWIVPVGLAACLPLMALQPPLIFVNDGRYAIIPFPLIAIALGVAVVQIFSRLNSRRSSFALAAALTAWIAVTTMPYLRDQRAFESAEPNAQQDRVIDRLEELGISRLAGTYWFVLPIEFRTDREIRTAIAGNPYVIRFRSSQSIVQNSPPETVAFLFPPGEQDPNWFFMPPESYRTEDFGSMVLYIPLAIEG